MSPVIVWFRQDLRLGDNPALRAAAATGAPILPLFVLDDETPGDWRWGGASRWWLHHALASLNESLRDHLVLRRGDAAKIVKTLVKETKALEKMSLVTSARLSVQPVTAAEWKLICKLGGVSV